jgi:hypothetical protein
MSPASSTDSWKPLRRFDQHRSVRESDRTGSLGRREHEPDPSSRPAAASRLRWTGASTGAATTPARIIEAFGARLHQQVDLDSLTEELLGAVDRTIQPTQASLWLRPQ